MKITGRSTILQILPSSSFIENYTILSTIKDQSTIRFQILVSQIETWILLNLLSLKSTSPYVDWWTHRREHWRTTLAASRSGWPSTWNCRGCSAGETRVLWPVSRLLHAGTRRRRRRRNKRMKIDGERLSALLAVLHRKGERLVPQLFTGNLVSSHTDDTYASFWLIDLLSIFIQFLEIWRSRGK